MVEPGFLGVSEEKGVDVDGEGKGGTTNMNLNPPPTEGTVRILVVGVVAYVSYPTSAKMPIVVRGLRIRTRYVMH